MSLPKRLQDGGSRETGVPLITNWKLCLKEINIFCFISTCFFLSVVLYSENRSGSILLVVKPARFYFAGCKAEGYARPRVE